MKGWLPRDEELSDKWHTTLTLLFVGFFAISPLYYGAKALLTRTFDPNDFCFPPGQTPTHMELMHGSRAVLAGLAQLDLAAALFLTGASTLRGVQHKNMAWVAATILAAIYGIAIDVLPVQVF